MTLTIIELIICNYIGFRSLRLCRSLVITDPTKTPHTRITLHPIADMPTRSGRIFSLLPSSFRTSTMSEETTRTPFDSPTSPSSPSQTPSQTPNTERRLSRLEHLLARFTTFVDRWDQEQAASASTARTPTSASTARTPTNANNPSVTTAAFPSSET